MLNMYNSPLMETDDIRKNILAERNEKPNFKKSMFGYEKKEVNEYLYNLNNLLESTKTSFQSENEQMRTEVFILSKERDNYVKQITAITEERDTYKSQCENENNQINKLNEVISLMEAKMNEYEQLLKEKDKTEELEKKLMETEQSLSTEKSQNEFLTSQNEQLILTNENINKQNSQLTSEMAALVLNAKRQKASVEGSLFSYKQDLGGKIGLLKNRLSEIEEVLSDSFKNCQKTERLVLDSLQSPIKNDE